MSVFKLYYFDMRARGETVRQLLHYGDIEYEDTWYSWVDKTEWRKIKPKMPFGQLPVLEVDGKMISQTGAINRYLGKRVGLYGKDADEDAEIDAIVENCVELWGHSRELFLEKDPERIAVLQKHIGEEVMPQYLDKFEKALEKEYFVGGRMTLADLYFVNDVLWPRDIGVAINLEKYPKLQALEMRVTSHPKIAAWIAKRPVTPY